MDRELVCIAPRDSSGHVIPLSWSFQGREAADVSVRHVVKLFKANDQPFGVTIYAHSDGFLKLQKIRSDILPLTVCNVSTKDFVEIIEIAPDEYSDQICGNSKEFRTSTQHRYFHHAMNNILKSKRPPTMLIIDEFIGGNPTLVETFKAKYPTCPVFLFLTHPVTWTLRRYGLEKDGGLAQLAERTLEYMAKHNLACANEEHQLKSENFLQLALNLQERGSFEETEYRSNRELPLFAAEPKLIHADLHPRYEHMDQEKGIEFTDQFIERVALLKACHGAITCSVPGLEPAAYAKVTESIGRPLVWIGPQFDLTPESQTILEEDWKSTITDVQAFLRPKRKRSVILVTFGSHSGLDDIHRDVLYQAIDAACRSPDFKYTFLVVINEITAQRSNSKSDSFRSEQVHIHTGWIDQSALLKTEKFVYFLTHGGFGGIVESLLSSTPMFIWPTGADQAVSAVYFTQNANDDMNCAIRINPAPLNKSLYEEKAGRESDCTPEQQAQLRSAIVAEKGNLLRHLTACFENIDETAPKHALRAEKLGGAMKTFMTGRAKDNIALLLSMSDPQKQARLGLPQLQ